MYKDTGSKEDAQKILEDLNDSDAAYNVKLPVNIRLDPKKPLAQWRVELNCTVSRLTHKISFKTLLSGVMIKWCEVAVEPHSEKAKALQKKGGNMVCLCLCFALVLIEAYVQCMHVLL